MIILNYFQFLLRPAVTQFLFDFKWLKRAVQAETFPCCRTSKNSSKKVSTFLASTSNQSLVRVWRMSGLNVPLAISNSVRFCFNFFLFYILMSYNLNFIQSLSLLETLFWHQIVFEMFLISLFYLIEAVHFQQTLLTKKILNVKFFRQRHFLNKSIAAASVVWLERLFSRLVLRLLRRTQASCYWRRG